MSQLTPPDCRIKRLFFTESSVIANSSYSTDEDSDTKVSISRFAQTHPNQANRVYLDIGISSDDEASDNPPYSFMVKGFIIMEFDPEDENASTQLDKIALMGTQAGIGAIREHIASATSRGPWGEFYVGPVIVPNDVEISNGESNEQ